jgi:hypothetical protein
MDTPHLPTHLNEDDLVLHYYGETTPRDEAHTTLHLASCVRCRGEFTRLQRVLGVIDETTVSVVDLPPSFERTVWARLEPNLRRERRHWLSWLVTSPAPLALAATVVVLVVGAFFAGRALSPAAPGGAPVATATATPADAAAADQLRERILLVDLGEHLDRSQMALVELASSEDEGQIDMSDERARAEQLVADTRLYRQAAKQAGDAAMSDLLDEIERVLTEVATTPNTVSASELADVRKRIASGDLLFKVRVVSSDVRERQKQALQRRTGQRS